MIDIKHAQQYALAQYAKQSTVDLRESALEVDLLLAHVLNLSRSMIYAYPEKPLTTLQWETFQSLCIQRIAGTPIAYLLKSRAFWSFTLKVTEDTLIPRPETELLVEQTLIKLKDKKHIRLLDLGTGSGAIALALASERPDWQIVAVDISARALTIARENARSLHLNHVEFYQSDWFTAIPTQSFDAIVTNPPYIAEEDPHVCEGDLRFEPELALTSGKDGLKAIKEIIDQSKYYLSLGGLFILEHGYDQHLRVGELLSLAHYQDIEHWQDLQGHPRVTSAWL